MSTSFSAPSVGVSVPLVTPQRMPLILFAVAVSFTGCGDYENRQPVFPVEGTVSFEGRPAAGAFVVFHPKNASVPEPLHPSAHVDQNGQFKLTSYDAGDGAPAGDYTVTVQWRQLVRDGQDVVLGPDVVPAQYSRPESTVLQAKVVEGPNSVPQILIRR